MNEGTKIYLVRHLDALLRPKLGYPFTYLLTIAHKRHFFVDLGISHTRFQAFEVMLQ